MTYTVTVQVADFITTGPIPASAYASVARASIDVSGTVVVSTKRQIVPLPGGVGTFQAEAGVAYRIHLVGVAGFEAEWFFSWTTACTAAELYRAHQIDPASLAPLPIPPSTQSLLDTANQILTQVQGYGWSAVPDPADADALQVAYPSSQLDPADADAIQFTTGA